MQHAHPATLEIFPGTEFQKRNGVFMGGVQAADHKPGRSPVRVFLHQAAQEPAFCVKQILCLGLRAPFAFRLAKGHHRKFHAAVPCQLNA